MKTTTVKGGTKCGNPQIKLEKNIGQNKNKPGSSGFEAEAPPKSGKQIIDTCVRRNCRRRRPQHEKGRSSRGSNSELQTKYKNQPAAATKVEATGRERGCRPDSLGRVRRQQY